MGPLRLIPPCALLALAILLGASDAALGHAVVLETSPADGELLEAAPTEVTVRFNEPVRPVFARILNAEGAEITPAGAIDMNDLELRIALPPSIAPGSYIASFRVMSLDSHPVGGSIIFSVGRTSSRIAAPANAGDDASWRIAIVAIRAIVYVGILGGAGGVLFLLLVSPAAPTTARSVRRIAMTFAATGCLAACMAIGVQGGLLLVGAAESLANPETWRAGFASPYGRASAAAAFGLIVTCAGLQMQTPGLRTTLAGFGAALALASFAMSGHIVTAASPWLTVPALLAHTCAVAFWVGSLLPLRRAIGDLNAAAAPLVERFSRLAIAAVGVLVAAGLVIAVLQVGRLEGLIETTYGRILLAKIFLVACLISIAALNKRRLSPALARREPKAASALRSAISAEIAVVAAILALTSALGATPPPRAFTGGAEIHTGHGAGDVGADGLAITLVTGDYIATILFVSSRSGVNEATLTLLNAAGDPVAALEITLIVANPVAGVEPIRRVAEPTGAGEWRVSHLLLAPPGRWTVRIDTLVTEFEKTTLATEFMLR